uniref:OSJNBb0085C12.11 protein n=1 Tax=Oryza sativa subsp. japonica TaxID=39947 RepID=Q7XTR0_ORYSJ|nr:OSJNBb0085C12.11 [Oryza sativa Japonica Group]
MELMAILLRTASLISEACRNAEKLPAALITGGAVEAVAAIFLCLFVPPGGLFENHGKGPSSSTTAFSSRWPSSGLYCSIDPAQNNSRTEKTPGCLFEEATTMQLCCMDQLLTQNTGSELHKNMDLPEFLAKILQAIADACLDDNKLPGALISCGVLQAAAALSLVFFIAPSGVFGNHDDRSSDMCLRCLYSTSDSAAHICTRVQKANAANKL